jgi:hypothetical protein
MVNNYEIEKVAVEHVMNYLKKQGENPVRQPNGHGVDIIAGDKYIDVKGCLKTATNIRMLKQVLRKLG